MSNRIFLSHSSHDKSAVRRLAVDLQSAGVNVWLDEWEITVGDRITQKIQEGLRASDYLAVWLTQHAVDSGWVEREWQSKYNDEVSKNAIFVLPLLADNCDLPPLLADKKFADFRKDYQAGLKELLRVVDPGANGQDDGGPAVLAIRSRPKYLYDMLGRDPESVVRHRRPAGRIEHKPEIVTLVTADGDIIEREFNAQSRSLDLKKLDSVTKQQLAKVLSKSWDIIHFDCVVGPEGELFLDDGKIQPSTLGQLLKGKSTKLVVLMDCDSVKVVANASGAGVSALIAATGSVPVIAAENFCRALYSTLAKRERLGIAFSNAVDAAAVELGIWDPSLFFLDGDNRLVF